MDKESPKLPFTLLGLLRPGSVERMAKRYRDKRYRDDNSIEWEEWAGRNPDKARDICLEVGTGGRGRERGRESY